MNDKTDPEDRNLPAPQGDPADGFEPIPEAIIELLKRAGLDTTDPKVVKVFLEASLMKFQGSLDFPPGQILRGWEEVYPGITGKLIEWRDKQTNHRHRLEKYQAEKAEKRADRGQWIAAGVALIGLSFATFLGYHGQTVASVFMMILSIGGPTAAVILAGRGTPPG